jgi:hypothetical protein
MARALESIPHCPFSISTVPLTAFKGRVRWGQFQMLDDVSLKPGLKLLWFGTGTDDRLIPTTKATPRRSGMRSKNYAPHLPARSVIMLRHKAKRTF